MGLKNVCNKNDIQYVQEFKCHCTIGFQGGSLQTIIVTSFHRHSLEHLIQNPQNPPTSTKEEISFQSNQSDV